MSVPCILVSPKRKIAGRLAVLKNALHFFGEFLVEGTAGSSVFRTFDSLSNSESEKADQSMGIEKQKFQKLPAHACLDSEKQNAAGSMDKQLKCIKRHRRWEVSKVYLACFHHP